MQTPALSVMLYKIWTDTKTNYGSVIMCTKWKLKQYFLAELFYLLLTESFSIKILYVSFSKYLLRYTKVRGWKHQTQNEGYILSTANGLMPRLFRVQGNTVLLYNENFYLFIFFEAFFAFNIFILLVFVNESLKVLSTREKWY